ncbi:MAG: ABC transporter substrate-binding protein [Thaumarchaeota archaeon]|nr:ABC transporter substrate-binding protein [Nitrososphaerota archaeon]
MPKAITAAIVVIIIVIAAVVGVYFYFGNQSSNKQVESIQFGTSVAISEEFIPSYVALHGGFWKQQGLNVTIVPFQGDPAQMKAVTAGQIEFGSTGLEGGLIAATNGAPFKSIAVSLQQADMVLIVANNSKYTSASQLKGATIGVTSLGSLTDIMFHVLAKQYNFTIGTDLHESALGGFQAQLAALTTNHTQGFFWTYDEGYALQDKNAGKILLFMSSLLPSWITETLYASNNMITNHPDLVKKVVQGWFNAVAYMKSNRTYAIQMTEQYMSVSAPVAAQVVDRAFFSAGNFSSNGQFTTDAIQSINYVRNLMISLNITNNVMPVDQYYTTQFVPVAGQNIKPTNAAISNHLFVADVASVVALSRRAA